MENELLDIVKRSRPLFLKYGIKSVSMDDVSRELGISKKTLYQHVIDKSDLVQKVVETDIDEKICNFDSIITKNLNAIEELFAVNLLMTEINKQINPSVEYDLRKYYPDLYKKIYCIKRDIMLAYIYNNLEKGKTEGLYRTDLDSNVIAKLHVGRIERILDGDLFQQSEITSQRVFNEIFVYHLHGICSVKGLELLNEKLQQFKLSNNE